MSSANDRLDHRRLVVGLGNPGSSYEETRHNLGFRVVKGFAARRGWSFRRDSNVSGELAQGMYAGRELLLLLPATYMNSSGRAVQKCIEVFGFDLAQLLVVVDDVALPFGALRFRSRGSSGGHNGLKSIEAHLLSRDYARLRIGIGDRLQGELTHHVLGHFTLEEQSAFPKVLEGALQAIEQWLKK